MKKLTMEYDGFKIVVERPENEISRILSQVLGIKINTVGQPTGNSLIRRTKRKYIKKKRTRRSDMPTSEQIMEHIKKQPKYKHNIRQIGDHFLKKMPKATGKRGKQKFDVLFQRIRRAREIIENSEKGKWTKTRNGFGKPATYFFKK